MKYATKVLSKADMLTSKASYTPMTSNDIVYAHIGDVFENSTYYRSIVRYLQYLIATRPNLSYGINKIFQYITKPFQHH